MFWSHAGTEAFDIDINEGDGLFYTGEEVAIAVLKRMASGEPYTDRMLIEESDRQEMYRTDRSHA